MLCTPWAEHLKTYEAFASKSQLPFKAHYGSGLNEAPGEKILTSLSFSLSISFPLVVGEPTKGASPMLWQSGQPLRSCNLLWRDGQLQGNLSGRAQKKYSVPTLLPPTDLLSCFPLSNPAESRGQETLDTTPAGQPPGAQARWQVGSQGAIRRYLAHKLYGESLSPALVPSSSVQKQPFTQTFQRS